MVPKHDKEGEEIGEQAEGMESGASYAIAQKRGPSVRFLSTAGSTPLFVVVPKHDKEGEEIGEQAESMESGASYAIAQKRGPSYARSRAPYMPQDWIQSSIWRRRSLLSAQEIRGGAARKFGAGQR